MQGAPYIPSRAATTLAAISQSYGRSVQSRRKSQQVPKSLRWCTVHTTKKSCTARRVALPSTVFGKSLDPMQRIPLQPRPQPSRPNYRHTVFTLKLYEIGPTGRHHASTTNNHVIAPMVASDLVVTFFL
jgi:hypothetical protein